MSKIEIEKLWGRWHGPTPRGPVVKEALAELASDALIAELQSMLQHGEQVDTDALEASVRTTIAEALEHGALERDRQEMRRRRRRLGLSQRAVADRLGVCQTVISSWEIGRNRPDDRMLLEWADALSK